MGLSSYYADQDPTLLLQLVPFNTSEGIQLTPLASLDAYLQDQLMLSAIFGVRVGAATIVTIMLLLLTQNRRNIVFALNLTSLILLIIQSGMFLGYLFGPFNSMAANFSGSLANVSAIDVSTSVATSWVQLMLVISVQASLLFQTRTVVPPKFRMAFTIGVFGVAILPTLVIWTFYVVLVSLETVDPTDYQTLQDNQWLVTAIWPIFAASVVFFSLIFSIKLYFVLRDRRHMGLKQLDVTQTFFIMAVQTMIVPAIFTVLQFSIHSHQQGLSAFTPLLVVICLPLSALWASFQDTAPHLMSQNFVPFATHKNIYEKRQR